MKVVRWISRAPLLVVSLAVRIVVDMIQIARGPKRGRKSVPEEWEARQKANNQSATALQDEAAQLRRTWQLRYALARRKFGRTSHSAKYRLAMGIVGLVLIIGIVLVFISRSSHGSAQALQVEAFPTNDEALKRSIIQLIKEKDYNRGLIEVSELRRRRPSDLDGLQWEGAILAGLKNYQGARQSLQKALEIDSSCSPALFNLGSIELSTGNYAKAEELLRQVKSKPPYPAAVGYRLYLCELKQGHADEAAAVIHDSRITPQSPEWYYLPAATAFFEGNKKEGQRLLDTARMFYPTSADSYEEMLHEIGLF
jgi:tetratricopeptide (TPR) repeat protein